MSAILEFQWSKTYIAHFQQSINQSSELKLNNSAVKEVESYKYLGDTKNSAGTLDANISNKEKAAMAITNEIKFLVDQPAFKKTKNGDHSEAY